MAGQDAPKGYTDLGFRWRLREAMGDRSHYDVAKAIGVSHELFWSFLTHKRPGADKAVRMAQVLGVPIEWLLTGARPLIRVKAPGYPRPRIRVKAIFQRVGNA